MKTIILILSSILLTACNFYKPYVVTLNDNVLYSPVAIEAHAELLADANLQGCLNQALQRQDLSDVDELTMLICPNAGVSSILGIDALVNLAQLDLSGNRINDLNPLTELRSLRSLNVSNNQVRNTSALNNLPMLSSVNLSGNPELSCRQLDRLEQRLGRALIRPANCI